MVPASSTRLNWIDQCISVAQHYKNFCICENFVEKWNTICKLQVTSSDIQVASSGLQVMSLTSWVAISNTRVSSSNPRITSSNSWVTSSNLQVTSSKAWVGKERVGKLKVQVEVIKPRAKLQTFKLKENFELKILGFMSSKVCFYFLSMLMISDYWT